MLEPGMDRNTAKQDSPCPERLSRVRLTQAARVALAAAIAELGIAVDKQNSIAIPSLIQEVRVIREHLAYLNADCRSHQQQHGC